MGTDRASSAELAALREIVDDVMYTFHPFHLVAAAALLNEIGTEVQLSAIVVERALAQVVHPSPPHPHTYYMSLVISCTMHDRANKMAGSVRVFLCCTRSSIATFALNERVAVVFGCSYLSWVTFSARCSSTSPCLTRKPATSWRDGLGFTHLISASAGCGKSGKAPSQILSSHDVYSQIRFGCCALG
jgi:hypothetical protein